MSKTPNFDKKVQAILAATKPGERTCALTGEKWMMTEEEIEWCRRFNVPSHPWAPLTRMKLLGGFNIGIELWWNKHAETGKPILSYVHPDNLFKVLPDLEWHNRDFSTIHTDPDLAAPFIPQVVALMRQIPFAALRQYQPPVNSIGVTTLGVEDSFMVFIFRGKRSCYCYSSTDVEDSMDIVYSRLIQNSSMLMHCARMHSCHEAFESFDCLNSTFLFDCRNCEHCFGATNQRNKKYLWWNEQLTKDEYERRLREVDLGSYQILQEYRKKFLDLVNAEGVWPTDFNIQSEQCTGEYIMRSTRVHRGFWLEDVTDAYYFWLSAGGGEDMFFVSGGGKSSHCYMSAGAPSCSNMLFCSNMNRCVNTEYCFSCEDCEDCFGCAGLKGKRFHILNKPYTEEEYEKRVDALKSAMLDRGEYGQFFPSECSPSGYRLSSVMFVAGATEHEADLFQAPRYDRSHGTVVTGRTETETPPLSTADLPDHIRDVSAVSVVKKPIRDAEQSRNYSIQELELDLLKRWNRPLPRQHFTSRLKGLTYFMNKPVFEPHTCANCSAVLEASRNFAFPSRRIFCQPCYLRFLEARG